MRLGAAEEQSFLTVAREAGLHEQLHVALAVRAGHVESHRAPLGPVAQQVLDHSKARVARIAGADGVQLDDRPLVAGAVALDAQQPREAPLVFVHEQQVVGTEGAERQPEEAEDPDARSADRQAERSRIDVLQLGEPRQFPQRGQVGQTGKADASAHMASPSGQFSVPRAADPPAGSSYSVAIVTMSRWKRVSPASSGWNEIASTLRWRTATTR